MYVVTLYAFVLPRDLHSFIIHLRARIVALANCSLLLQSPVYFVHADSIYNVFKSTTHVISIIIMN